MSVRPAKLKEVPEQTAKVAKAAFPKGNFCLTLRDKLGPLYQETDFTPLFSAEGSPAFDPWILAVVSILQFVEGLTDRQAVLMVQSRIDWKYLLGLELIDTGFDYSVLSEFRGRLLTGEAEKLLLDSLLEQLRELKLLKAGGKQRSDSTQVIAAVRLLNRLEMLGETLRSSLNALAVAAPVWLVEQIPLEWFDLYGRRIEEYRLPRQENERKEWALDAGVAGFSLVQALHQQPDLAWLLELPALETLRQIWVQQFWLENGEVRLRETGEMPKPGKRIHSPYDIEARYATKREIHWLGYKVHLTESCEEDSPNLITQVLTTEATVPDVKATAPIEQSLADRNLLPQQHIVDGGYVSSELLLEGQSKHHLELVGPLRLNASWQSLSAEGYDSEHFKLDWVGKRAECPQGQTSTSWKTAQNGPEGREYVLVRFAHKTCLSCEVREKCTRNANRGRLLYLRPQAEHEAILAQKHRQGEVEFKKLLDMRSGIEGTLSQAVRVFGLRRCRYRGLEKTRLQHLLTAVALNLVRLWAWWEEVPRATSRVSRLKALKPAA
jgi:transposase